MHNDKKAIMCVLLSMGLASALPAEISAAGAAGSMAAQAEQTITVKGVVKDAEGPLIGATVAQKGNPTNGTSTDIDGNFTLKVPAGAMLMVSYVGYEPKEVRAEPNMTIDMTQKDNVLNEVVVVGFGTQKRVNLTGAVSTADVGLLEDRPLNNVANALQGVVPGLQINQGSGNLAENPSINIRGNGTIGDGSSGAPLVLIDGMEGDINTLNPQDVASVSVLKDAAAASIYGSRAPFGVILITTKKGASGKPVISYQNSFRWSSLMNLSQTMDSYKFAQYFNDARYSSPQGSQYFSDDQIDKILKYQSGQLTEGLVDAGNGYWKNPYDPDAAYGNTDWYGEIFKKTTFSQEHNLSVSGGSDKITYYFSANFSNHDGNMRFGENSMKKYNINGRFSAQLFPWMKLGYNGRWNRQDYIRPSSLTDGLYDNLGRQGWPMIPLYDNNGYLYDAPTPALGLAEGGDDTFQTDRNTHQLELVFNPLQGWDIHAELNYNVLSETRHWDAQQLYNHKVNGDPYLYRQSSNVHEEYKRENFFNINLFSNYDFTIAEKNDFHVMLGFQTENMKQLKFGHQRDGILVPGLPVTDLTSGLDVNGKPITPAVNGGKFQWDTAGFFGRINYNYDSRYLLEANLRYDGTSRFRSDRRWIWLPSFSAGWNIANEKFWEDYSTVMNQFKLRASWGMLGNQNTNNWYQTYRVIGLGMSDGWWIQNGVRPNTAGFPALVSESLTWEKVYNWNFGLDFAFLNNRLRGSMDYFIRNTKNMVGPAPELPATLGTGVPKTNNCDMRTNGWDFEISWNDQTSWGLSYGARFVLSDAFSTVTRYPNNPSNTLPENNPNDPKRYIQGRHPGEIWGYETVGIAKTQAEMDAHLKNNMPSFGDNWKAGDIMYKDLDGNGVVNNGANTLNDHGDVKLLGNSTPRWLFSLDLHGEYKGFDLRVYFQGVAKRDYWQGSGYFWGVTNDIWWSQGLKQHEDYFRDENSWSVKSGHAQPNPDAYYPRPVFSEVWKNQQAQSRYIQDASYIRLKNLQVGYSLPKNIVSKIGFQLIRIYFSGENLWTGTKLSSLFDPETVGSGKGGCCYPLSRTYSFGLNITL